MADAMDATRVAHRGQRRRPRHLPHDFHALRSAADPRRGARKMAALFREVVARNAGGNRLRTTRSPPGSNPLRSARRGIRQISLLGVRGWDLALAFALK